MFVLQRIVVVGGNDQFASRRQFEGRVEVISELPVETVFRNGEHRFLTSVGIDDGVLEVLASEVRMRLELVNRHRFGIRRYSNYFVIFSVRRNRGNHHAGAFGFFPGASVSNCFPSAMIVSPAAGTRKS